MKKYFMNPENKRLRSGWRITIFIFFYILFSKVLSKLALSITGKLDRTTLDWWVIRGFLVIIASTIVVWLVRKFIDKKPLVSLGLKLNTLAIKDFFVGLGISGLMIGTLYVVFLFLGLLEITSIGWTGKTSTLYGIILWFFGIGLAIGWSEELAFRGYLLQNMKEGIGIKLAVIISCILYGAMHMANPGSTLLSGTLIALIGFIRIYGWLSTGQLWLSMGMHAGWDFIQGPILGLAVSGMKTESLIVTNVYGTEWLTGGGFGPEASILVLPFLALGFFVMFFYTRKRKIQLRES